MTRKTKKRLVTVAFHGPEIKPNRLVGVGGGGGTKRSHTTRT